MLLIPRVFPSMDRKGGNLEMNHRHMPWVPAMRGSDFSKTAVFYPSNCLDSASRSMWQSAARSLLLPYCYVQPRFELYHSVGVQINIPYNKDMYVLLRISTSSCGSIDGISILRLIRELNCEIVREAMSGLIAGGVAMPTFQAEDFILLLWGGCFVVFGFSVSPLSTLLIY